MKVGLIRCMQTEDVCPAANDFRSVKEKTGIFEGIEEEIEIVAVNTCGGCPGKKAVPRTKNMIDAGADTIVFASCIKRGTPFGYPCPFAQKMIDTVTKFLGKEIKILDYTHL